MPDPIFGQNGEALALRDATGSFGVLGVGTPIVLNDVLAPGPQPVDAAGVWGLACATEDIGNIFTEDGGPFPAGVAGRNALRDRGVGVSGEWAPFGETSRASGFLAGSDPTFHQHAGVYGQSDKQGVMGLTTVPDGTGVYGGGTSDANGKQIGVRGETVNGIGVKGQSFGAGPAGHFFGDVLVDGKLIVNGNDFTGLLLKIETLEKTVAKLTAFLDAVKSQPVTEEIIHPVPHLQPTDGGSLVQPPNTFGSLISGGGFSPLTPVFVRVSNGGNFNTETSTTSDQVGNINVQVLHHGGRLFFAASDHRSDPRDWTGFLWSNTVRTG